MIVISYYYDYEYYVMSYERLIKMDNDKLNLPKLTRMEQLGPLPVSGNQDLNDCKSKGIVFFYFSGIV